MKIKYLALAIILGLFGLVNSNAQTSRPSPSPQTVSAEKQATIDSLKLQMQLLLNETKAKGYALDPKANPDARTATNGIAEVYREASNNPKLTLDLIAKALDEYYGLRVHAESPAQVSQAVNESSLRLLLLQTAQNQTIIEQNKKIIQILQEIAKSRR